MSLDNTEAKNKQEIVLNFGKNEKDTGSATVQIALLSFRVNKLHKHFLENKKDYHSRRGLLNMVAKRRKLLNYLKYKKFNEYINLINRLGLRK